MKEGEGQEKGMEVTGEGSGGREEERGWRAKRKSSGRVKEGLGDGREMEGRTKMEGRERGGRVE